MKKTQINKTQLSAALSAALLMLAYGFFNAVPGYFMEAVTAELGCCRAQFSLQLSLISVVSLLTAPYFGRKLKSMRALRYLILFGAFAGGGAYLICSLSKTVIWLYAAACLMGFAANNCSIVCAAALLERVFPGKSGGITGLVMSVTGIAGTVAGLVLPGLILSLGWRSGYRVDAAIWFSLLLMSYLCSSAAAGAELPISDSAEEKGRDSASSPFTVEALLFSAAVLLICVNVVFAQHMPSFYGSFGSGAVSAGRMTGLFNLILFALKIFVGSLYDRIGPAKCLSLCVAGYIVGMLLQFAAYDIPTLLLPGLVISAIGHTVTNVLLPLLTARVFGRRDFPSRWSFFSGLSMLGFALGSPLWGAMRDLMGSYRPALLIFPALMPPALAIMLFLLKKSKSEPGASRR